MSNYDHRIGFEISPRNVAIDNGRLVLLDCFFSIDLLQERNREKRGGRGLNIAA